jgi:hypothetical protein
MDRGTIKRSMPGCCAGRGMPRAVFGSMQIAGRPLLKSAARRLSSTGAAVARVKVGKTTPRQGAPAVDLSDLSGPLFGPSSKRAKGEGQPALSNDVTAVNSILFPGGDSVLPFRPRFSAQNQKIAGLKQ